MKNIEISVINEDRMEQLELAFDAQQEIREQRLKIDSLEEKMREFLKGHKEFEKLYLDIDVEKCYCKALQTDFTYEAGFRDALKFLMNGKA